MNKPNSFIQQILIALLVVGLLVGTSIFLCNQKLINSERQDAAAAAQLRSGISGPFRPSPVKSY